MTQTAGADYDDVGGVANGGNATKFDTDGDTLAIHGRPMVAGLCRQAKTSRKQEGQLLLQPVRVCSHFMVLEVMRSMQIGLLVQAN